MDKLNIRIEAARLAVESGADKETFDEMAKVIEKYIIGTLDLSEYDNPMKYGYNDNSFSWIWIYLLTLIFNRTWK